MQSKLPIRVLLASLMMIGFAEGYDSSAAVSEHEDLHAASAHDMLLLLPTGPLHLRVSVADAGESLMAAREQYMQRLVATLDVDQDGKVSRQETVKHPLFVSGRRFEGNAFLESLRTQRDYAEKDLALAVQRAAGQLISFRQNSSLADQDLNVFRVLDADESGLIERAEMRTAAARLAARDFDFDQCITFDELSGDVPGAIASPLVAVVNNEPPPSIHSDMLRDAAEPTLPIRLVRLYDTDRDAKLSAEELGWAERACQSLDADGDNLLNVQELTGIVRGTPDLWLAVDLSSQSDVPMQLIGGRLISQSQTVSESVVKLAQATGSLTVSYRHRDPLGEARQNALSTFNAIDADGNGYMDRDEIAEHQRFERYLFNAMDADGDERVFAEEMLAYVNAYTEPATTSCQVTLFDMGNGMFPLLDTNGDGRVSIRELRAVEEVLLAASDQSEAINPSQQLKAYRVEIQRGGVSLFGRVDRPEAETPTASFPAAAGPIWFQRMDRNRDGDLTWDEFLGPREVFHRLDGDQDGLIDAREAKSYENS